MESQRFVLRTFGRPQLAPELDLIKEVGPKFTRETWPILKRSTQIEGLSSRLISLGNCKVPEPSVLAY
jgi:hypothetical protein